MSNRIIGINVNTNQPFESIPTCLLGNILHRYVSDNQKDIDNLKKLQACDSGLTDQQPSGILHWNPRRQMIAYSAHRISIGASIS